MTANTKPLTVEGKLVLQISDVGPNEFIGRYTCSLLGWSRNPVVGSGNTAEAAIRDWCRYSNVSYETVTTEYTIQHPEVIA
jgi:hypothetical protein